MLKQLARGAGIVALGTLLGQGAILIATPWLARLYTPAEFGALALIMSVANVAMTGACFRYDLALPAAKGHYARPLLIVAIACALCAALGVFCANAVILTLSLGRLRVPFDTPGVVALCVLLTGIQQAVIGWATRARAFGRIAGLRAAQGVSFSALAAVPHVGLVLAHVLSFAVAIPALRRVNHAQLTEGVGLLETARRYREFPLVSLPGALLDVVGYSACIWVVSSSYGASGAGQFAQIQRIVGAPLMLAGMSLGQVLLRHSADVMAESGQLNELFSRLLKVLGLLGLAVLLVIAAIGEPVLHWVLGTQWRADVLFITPIALAVTVRACVSPLSTILVTLRRFDLALRWQAAYFLSASTLLWLATSHLTIEGFVIFYAVHECLFYLGYLLLVNSAIRSWSCAESSA